MRLSLQYFEDLWFTGGEIELTFVKAVHQKQSIVIRASVAEKTEIK